ncbi:hypothetical protein ABMA27_004902 [Loxostege sticticalis]|uniref:Uncharacterized protein n=1 Tax=Loxostege sticticalis TaxID=481309 RepID=A0ABR3HL12_LOXSC
MSFNNKVVLVTGASSGIGAAIALKFAEEGANVAIVGRNEDKLKNVTENIAKVGNKPLVIVADMTKDNDVQRIVNETLKQFGKLDVLVNNAGVGGNFDITDENAMKRYDNIISTNLRRYIIETKGNIINISSVAGQLVWENGFAYCTSKAALDHFSRAIALDFAPKGVRVNTISPGPVMTDIFETLGYKSEAFTAMIDGLIQKTALKRISDPAEMAELALFLASDKAVGITGSTYVTDNGFML